MGFFLLGLAVDAAGGVRFGAQALRANGVVAVDAAHHTGDELLGWLGCGVQGFLEGDFTLAHFQGFGAVELVCHG
ncbi:hypothetical protein QKW35_20500 [Pontibacterium granulatum]|nr:hypothetical protein [Pontibacterium granulatum]MDI3326764.1 hypothetical protein [Pontibacterium granulatum]